MEGIVFARCVRGARLASLDDTVGPRGHIARLHAVDPCTLAFGRLIRGQRRLEADLSRERTTREREIHK